MRGWILAGAGLVGVFVLFAALGEAFGGGPRGPASSSYATGSQGLAAWAELLHRDGHPVEALRTPLNEAHLNPRATMVVLDPEALLRSEGVRLLSFVRTGGRLLIGGGDPQRTLGALLHLLPAWSAGASTRDLPVAGDGAILTGVRHVESAGEGEWQSAKGYRTLLRSASGGALLLERGLGRGELEPIADASPLQNRLLASADNAQLGLDLAAGPRRRVVFVESVHGFGESRGLAALPTRFWLVALGLALAGLVWVGARARRLGPPERAGADGSPPRSAYVQAISRLLRRTGRSEEIAAALTRLRNGR